MERRRQGSARAVSIPPARCKRSIAPERESAVNCATPLLPLALHGSLLDSLTDEKNDPRGGTPMSTATAGWWRRHGRALLVAGLAVAVLGMVVEGFFLYQERITHRDMQAQSDTLLTRFLSGDTAHAAGASGVAIRLQNVRFKWSDNVYIDAGDMAIRAVPLKGTTVAFDDLETFRLKLQRSVV